MAPLDDKKKLLAWYHALTPLRVDIIGDFAGKELFAIHGDALLLHCVSDAQVDFNGKYNLDIDGFQLLHAIHAVETFLSNLKARGCQFQIVWFRSHESLCVPTDSSDVESGCHRLTRAILIKHLRHHSLGDEITFEFPNVESSEFQDYIAENSLRFFLCLDGFAYDGASPLAVQHLAFINHIGSSGYSVALINSFEFKSSKAFASMLPPSRGRETFRISEPTMRPETRIIHLSELERKAGVIGVDWSPWDDGTPVSARDTVSLAGVCNVLLHDSSDAMKSCVAAYILHLSNLKHCGLSERPCSVVYLEEVQQKAVDRFLSRLADICTTVVETLPIQEHWDVFDLLDGRLIRQILKLISTLSPSPAIIAEATKLATRIHLLTKVNISAFLPQTSADRLAMVSAKILDQSDNVSTSVMTFSHVALDKYLQSIHVVANDATEPAGTSKVFQELSHWHNAKTAVDPKSLPKPAGFFARKRNQKLMADTIAYSASLTNTAGKIINPETIVTFTAGAWPVKQNGRAEGTGKENVKPQCVEFRPKKKKNPTKGGRESAREEAQRIQREKLDSKARDIMTFWDERCHELQTEKGATQRLAKAIAYLSGLSNEGLNLIGAEVYLYICDVLVSMILDGQGKYNAYEMALFAKLWSMMLEAGKLTQSSESLRLLDRLSNALKMPIATTTTTTHLLKDRRLPFPSSSMTSLQLPVKPLDFQLEHCGPFLERSFDPAPDVRVPSFVPDAWQRKVLDAIDSDKSLFVVAPTSAGKTFISFYAMKQVLQSSDDGILVYVAPTKALVNQIAAEIQARFSKTYNRDGRSIWAIHTRDYRINNPTGCQVLVTVPHILQIMLLAPSNAENANSWSARVKRIVFDEIHCIGQADDGVIWEQLLLLAPCPIIALSATVGNPLEFMQWLEATENVKGRDMEMIVHSSRYSDLRKFFYKPSERSFIFSGLPQSEGPATPGLDEGPAPGLPFRFIHPIVSLTNRNRGTIDDIILEPRDCMLLWRSMAKHQTKEYPMDDALSPANFLPAIVKRSEVLQWGKSLKNVLQIWIEDVGSPFSAVQAELGTCLSKTASSQIVQASGFDDNFSVPLPLKDQPHLSVALPLLPVALPLLTDLHKRGALPGILFNYDRDCCERTALHVLEQLETTEQKWKNGDLGWDRKISEYREWKKTSSDAKAGKKKPTQRRGQDDDELSKIEVMREASIEPSKWESFDPDAPLDRFSFADGKRLPSSELETLVERLRSAGVKPDILGALRRGIAVHHAGMNRQYRQVVEMLFRKGFLRVVVATGTLALGINMPCKTVVFFGDSVFLTALNYHQASGRAGRRGFDLLGNVVFVGMPLERALEIMSSRLPDLGGHFPLSTTLVLRLLGLLHHTKNSDYAKKAIQSILSQSRLYLGGPSDQMSIQHHLRFSIEYLRRQRLLSQDGVPLNFAGLVGHLYFTENAVFAFHSLLKGGYFHQLCEPIDRNPEAVLIELILVLAHLFCRIPLGLHSNLVNGHKSPSVITLPPLPEEAATILQGHNQETLNIFRLYVSTFIEQHLSQTPDTKLPFTGYEIKPQQQNDLESHSMVPHLPPTKLRSPFSALSGLTDEFDTIHELCATVRSGVFLEESAVPYIRIYPADTDNKPWNAYLYDFFKHGDLKALVRDNRIKRGDVWFHLKDFSLVLATVVTSLENFVNLDGNVNDDAAMMDMQDADDDTPEIRDEAKQPSSNAAGKPPVVQNSRSKPVKTRKKKVELDSWEDDVSDDDEDGSLTTSEVSSSADDLWQQDDGDGSLPQVLKAFRMLREEFEEKFRKVWA